MSIDRVYVAGRIMMVLEKGVSCIEGINPVNLLMSVDGIQVSDLMDGFRNWIRMGPR